jgi:phosphate transport system substrate-binding protein
LLAAKEPPIAQAAKLAVTRDSALRGPADKRPASARGVGVVAIDGSSTVYPITEAVAEEFRARHAAQVTVGVSGTRGGFEKLCKGEVAISGASRPPRPSEVAACQAAAVEYVELPIAYDGITVVVHPDNHWATELTLGELAALWRPEAQRQVERWSQLRSGWPDSEIHLLGPGVGSGTYDFFTRAVVGREHESRGDYGASEDDDVIAQGVGQDPLALGFFGYAYYARNRERLRAVGIDDGRSDNGRGAVWPSAETVRNGSYAPLSRPLFLYVSVAKAADPEVAAFVSFYLEHAERLAREVGYVALSEAGYSLARQRFQSGEPSPALAGAGDHLGVTVEPWLAAE